MGQGEIGIFIDRTYKVVRQDLINRFKNAAIDLTPEQWVIVSKLHHEGEMSQTELAAESFKDKPTVSRILDLLAKKGYVTRRSDEIDRRKFNIAITPKGEDIIKLATPEVEASRAVGWSNLSQDEYQNLIVTLDKIFANYTNGIH
jgi:DNA-binding MarR family transcriptional regulator